MFKAARSLFAVIGVVAVFLAGCASPQSGTPAVSGSTASSTTPATTGSSAESSTAESSAESSSAESSTSEQPAACSQPISGTIKFYRSSVPPPYHYEWTLTVDGTAGTFSVTPGYGDPLQWSKDFTAADGADVALCEAILAVGPGKGDAPPGADMIAVELTAGDASITYDSPGGDDAVVAAAQAFVPAELWSELFGYYDEWADNYDQG